MNFLCENNILNYNYIPTWNIDMNNQVTTYISLVYKLIILNLVAQEQEVNAKVSSIFKLELQICNLDCNFNKQ